METPKVVKNTIAINAPAAVVWDALVNPQKTKIYMFGCETVSDWNAGSELLWRGSHEGREMVFVKGKILKIEPEKLLKYTVIDPFASYPDVPENYLNVTYDLSPKGVQTILTICQDGFENAAEGEKRYKDVYNNGEGWNPILVEIKKLAEEN
ncbi:SRPBCC domain-containing protein [Mucilaginibacter sp.]|uniref:SRPBCC domain-containing protein n=1 Tax=Mucilaginibacter sp. TaxID=1882438 RepID=UPI003B007B03